MPSWGKWEIVLDTHHLPVSLLSPTVDSGTGGSTRPRSRALWGGALGCNTHGRGMYSTVPGLLLHLHCHCTTSHSSWSPTLLHKAQRMG